MGPDSLEYGDEQEPFGTDKSEDESYAIVHINESGELKLLRGLTKKAAESSANWHENKGIPYRIIRACNNYVKRVHLTTTVSIKDED